MIMIMCIVEFVVLLCELYSSRLLHHEQNIWSSGQSSCRMASRINDNTSNKRFHRNQKDVGMAMVNEVLKQGHHYSTLHCHT